MNTSVLINTYNHSSYIEECIDSVLGQSFPPTEIIVYDDGSQDDTVSRLERYGERVTVIKGQRRNAPSHLNQANAVQTAFDHSRGDLIFLLDGDDAFLPTKVERYVDAFLDHPDAALIQAPMLKVNDRGMVFASNLERRKHISEHIAEIYRQQDVDFYYPTSALAFSRRYLSRVLPLDFTDGQPLWLDTRLSIVSPYFGRVITLDDPLTHWRRHSGSDSIRARNRTLQLRQTMMRTRVFNRFCRQHHLRTISPWRNRRFYLQLTRYVMPEAAYRFLGRGVATAGAPRTA